MTTLIMDRTKIEAALADADVLEAMERAFLAYSDGRAIVPPVGELLFDDPPGDAHIKYGYISGDDHFVIKVATGFYDNAAKGLPSNSGLMVIFDARTGLPAAVLLDEGHLTNVRTAAAGAVAARHLAPSRIERIGICGTGVQARMQLELLKSVTDCRDVFVWGRSAEKAEAYRREMETRGFRIELARSPGAIGANCNLIITATIATKPMLEARDIRPGTHVTAMGSDTPEKNEIDPQALVRADVLVADSLSQCLERGEIHHAVGRGLVDASKVVELGAIISGRAKGRRSETEISIADLTGVAVQDIEICKEVLRNRAHAR